MRCGGSDAAGVGVVWGGEGGQVGDGCGGCGEGGWVGILRNFKDESIAEDEFLTRWMKAVGDTFESTVSLTLLSVCPPSLPTSHQLTPHSPIGQLSFQPLTNHPKTLLTYFPSSTLPLDPAHRFSDLFLTRPKWLAADIAPFLTDCAVDEKERDKLLLKYARNVAEGARFIIRHG